MINKKIKKFITSLSDKNLAEALEGFKLWHFKGELNEIANKISKKIKTIAFYPNEFIYEALINESVNRWLKIISKEL